jgi:hypothetical protein
MHNSKSNRITGFHQGSDFSHGLGQQYAFGDATRDGSIAPKAATQTGVVRPKPLSSGSLWERNEFGLVAGHLREAAFLPVLLGLLDPVL